MRVAFDRLPDHARVWVFGASSPLAPASRDQLLAVVDAYLDQWQAHGAPLTCARDWRDERFLVVGVDQSVAGASGCSIDALFRALQGLEREVGTSLVAGGRVFFRDTNGNVRCTDRPTFARLAGSKQVGASTPVFDVTVTSAGDYRARFERVAGESWHAALLN
jgi:hypothetical protein